MVRNGQAEESCRNGWWALEKQGKSQDEFPARKP